LLNIITAEGARVSEKLVRDRYRQDQLHRLDRRRRRIAGICAERGRRVNLERGGKSARAHPGRLRHRDRRGVPAGSATELTGQVCSRSRGHREQAAPP